jgi:hypothetical protein
VPGLPPRLGLVELFLVHAVASSPVPSHPPLRRMLYRPNTLLLSA